MRRGDPERIYQAHRAGIFARLTQNERLDELDAEHWISVWEHHAEAEGLSPATVGFWATAWDWIAKQRAPKRDMNAEADDGQVYELDQVRRSRMNQLIVIAFDHFDDARSAMANLRAIEREGRIQFEDTAIVERDPDGTAHVKNEVSGTTETAAVVGALIGGVVTFVFPLAGIAIGAALGAAIGAALDRGVSNDFVDEVKTTLRPGRSALFLVVKESYADATLAALRQFRGDVIQTTLDSEAEEALRMALD